MSSVVQSSWIAPLPSLFEYAKCSPEEQRIYESLLFDQQLSAKEIAYTIHALAPHRLAALLSWRGFRPTTMHVRPTVFIPLASLIEKLGVSGASEHAEQLLGNLANDLELDSALSICTDRWVGHFKLTELLEAYTYLRKSVSAFTVTFVGPSTAELHALILDRTREQWDIHALVDIFDELREGQVRSIDGGSDIRLHRLAASNGFRVSIAQDLDAEQESLEQFAQQLLQAVMLSESTENFSCWYPRITECQNTPLHYSWLLKTLALGRLVLPDVPYIRAPLRLLPEVFRSIVKEFGANDYGYAALNTQTSDALQICRYSEIEGLTRTRVNYLRIGTERTGTSNNV